MKKLVLAVAVLFLPGWPSVATAHLGVNDLIAVSGDGTTKVDVGDVTVDHRDDIVVTYTTTATWILIETHVHVGQSLDDFPLTKKGAPILRDFTRSNSHDVDDGLRSFTYTIPIGTSTGKILVAAHAVTVDTGTSITEVVAFSEAGIDAWGKRRSAAAAWMHPDWPQMPPAVWISTDQFAEEPFGDDSWRRFQAQINVDVDGFIVGGTVSAACDDAAEVYWNGAFIGSDSVVQGDVGDNLERNTTRDYAIPPMSGLNTLDCIVRDYACGPDSLFNTTGLIYQVEVECQRVETAWGGMWDDSNDKPANQFPDKKSWAAYMEHNLDE